MTWLRNKDNGSIYSVLEESGEYKFLAGVKSAVDSRPLYEELGLQEVTADQAGLPTSQFTIVKYFGAVTTAADDVNTSFGLAPCDGTLLSLSVVVSAAVVGQATNYRTLTLFDDGSPLNSGSSYSQINAVSMASEAFSSAPATLAVGTENVIALGTAAVACNDVLRFASIHTGTGLVFPDGVALATFSKKS